MASVKSRFLLSQMLLLLLSWTRQSFPQQTACGPHRPPSTRHLPLLRLPLLSLLRRQLLSLRSPAQASAASAPAQPSAAAAAAVDIFSGGLGGFSGFGGAMAGGFTQALMSQPVGDDTMQVRHCSMHSGHACAAVCVRNRAQSPAGWLVLPQRCADLSMRQRLLPCHVLPMFSVSSA